MTGNFGKCQEFWLKNVRKMSGMSGKLRLSKEWTPWLSIALMLPSFRKVPKVVIKSWLDAQYFSQIWCCSVVNVIVCSVFYLVYFVKQQFLSVSQQFKKFPTSTQSVYLVKHHLIENFKYSLCKNSLSLLCNKLLSIKAGSFASAYSCYF